MSEFKIGAGTTEDQLQQFFAYLFAQASTGTATTGVLAGLSVVQTATASGSVLVNIGMAVAQSSLTAGADPLLNNSQKTIDVLGANPMGSVARNDLIVFNPASAAVELVVGIPNVTPDDPTAPTGSVPLARLAHTASATTVPTSRITDLRVFTRLNTNVPTVLTGTAVLTGDATNQRYLDVTFPTAFPSTPTILLQSLTGMTSSGTTQSVWPSGESSTGFRVNGVRNNTTNMSVRWFAFYLA